MGKKILLITLNPKTHRTSEENLGLSYLKAVLVEQFYQVKIIDGWLNSLSLDEVIKQVKENKEILFIGISTYMSNTQATIDLIKQLKENNINAPVVVGGFGPTFTPHDYLKAGADIAVRGEAENTIVLIAKMYEGKEKIENINGISYILNNQIVDNKPMPLIVDLNELPFPVREQLDILNQRKSVTNIVTARGCSGNCEFCSVVAFFKEGIGKKWRTRSIGNIITELKYLASKGIKYIKVVDDSFIDGTRDDKWAEDFANQVKINKLDLQLRGQIRADKVTDKNLLSLKEAGFFSFACGIENGSKTALKRMNKHADLAQNQKALDLFKKHGYIVQMGFILFDPETTFIELEENLAFLKKNDFVIMKGIFSEMYAAIGTNLTKRLESENNLIASDFIVNNNKYQIKDKSVGLIYEALKKWHKSHSRIYDMTIDPITSPKAIPVVNILEFYQQALALKKLDLILFEKILNDKNNAMDIVLKELENTKKKYLKIEKEVDKLYKENGLVYDAELNPFIK